jgi:hypothetical protein
MLPAVKHKRKIPDEVCETGPSRVGQQKLRDTWYMAIVSDCFAACIAAFTCVW